MRWAWWLPVALVVAATSARAQQYVTDDTALTERHACQLEGWWGARAAWLLPACHFIPNVELTLGMGWPAGVAAEENPTFVLQAKGVLPAPEAQRWRVGLVAGLGFDRLEQVLGRGGPGLFAYVPATLALAAGRLRLHANLGWRFEQRNRAGDLHALTYAARADAQLHPLVGVTLEGYGDSATAPDWQAGATFSLVPDWLSGTVSYGERFGGSGVATGWVVGLTLTPPALW